MTFVVEYGSRRRFFDREATFRKLREEKSLPEDGEAFLPPLNSDKPTLVLDLDETLVYIKCKRGCLFGCHCGEGDQFYIAKRPGVDAFLSRVAELYELVLWTASPQVYADGALAILDPDGTLFSHRLYRQHLDLGLVKNLEKLGRDMNRLLVVDDTKSKFLSSQLRNLIVVQRFISDEQSPAQEDKLHRLGELLTRLAAEAQRGESICAALEEEQDALVCIRGGAAAGRWQPSETSSNGVRVEARVETPVYVPSSMEDHLGEPSHCLFIPVY